MEYGEIIKSKKKPGGLEGFEEFLLMDKDGISYVVNVDEISGLIFNDSPAAQITDTQITNWDTAFNWGDHSVVGYALAADLNIAEWDAAYSWGDHSLVGYLTVETDPVFVASDAYGITQTDIDGWDTATGEGHIQNTDYQILFASNEDIESGTPELLSNLEILRFTHDCSTDASIESVLIKVSQFYTAIAGFTLDIIKNPTQGQVLGTSSNTSLTVYDHRVILSSPIVGDNSFIFSTPYAMTSGDTYLFLIYPSEGPLSSKATWQAWASGSNHPVIQAYYMASNITIYNTLVNDSYFKMNVSSVGPTAGTVECLAIGVEINGVTANPTNWNTAFGWGDHALAGYLTSFTESDPTVGSHIKAITSGQIANWNTSYGWGNHASAGYLTSFTESDPTVGSHIKAITSGNIADWGTAYTHSQLVTGNPHAVDASDIGVVTITDTLAVDTTYLVGDVHVTKVTINGIERISMSGALLVRVDIPIHTMLFSLANDYSPLYVVTGSFLGGYDASGWHDPKQASIEAVVGDVYIHEAIVAATNTYLRFNVVFSN